jgi:hypothetical protein
MTMKSSDVQNPKETLQKQMERGDKLRAASLDWAATPIKDARSFTGHDPLVLLRRMVRRRSRDGKSVAFDAADARQRLHRALDAIMDRKAKPCRSESTLAEALDAIEFPPDSREVSSHRSYQADKGKCGDACTIKGERVRKLCYTNPFDPHRKLDAETRFRFALRDASSEAEIEQILSDAAAHFA